MGPKSGWGGVGLSQTSPIPRSPDGDNKVDLQRTSSIQGVPRETHPLNWRDMYMSSMYFLLILQGV